jgi:hypothetical protein
MPNTKSTQYQVIIPAALPPDAQKRLNDEIQKVVNAEVAKHDIVVDGTKLVDLLKPGKIGPINGMFPPVNLHNL